MFVVYDQFSRDWKPTSNIQCNTTEQPRKNPWFIDLKGSRFGCDGKSVNPDIKRDEKATSGNWVLKTHMDRGVGV